jgi:SAM-dependent methyltransferase
MLCASNALFDPAAYAGKKKSRGAVSRDFLPSPSVNLSFDTAVARLKNLLAATPGAKVLLVGGGQQRADLARRLGESVRVIATDVDVYADVDLFCDGHSLPFRDQAFAAVVTTAVMEHVLYPEVVAAEISRVVRDGGYLYSELPFMQQVHEGAYDFTRYTMSGHRRLFNGFRQVAAGMVAGPGTALVWSLEAFFLALFPASRARMPVKACVRVIFFWLKFFDYVFRSRPSAIDGASCTYFLGQKSGHGTTDSEIISTYSGAQSVRHT